MHPHLLHLGWACYSFIPFTDFNCAPKKPSTTVKPPKETRGFAGMSSVSVTICDCSWCTLAESYSEGATLSQFIILTKKGKTYVKTVDRKGFFIIIFFNLIFFNN